MCSSTLHRRPKPETITQRAPFRWQHKTSTHMLCKSQSQVPNVTLKNDRCLNAVLSRRSAHIVKYSGNYSFIILTLMCIHCLKCLLNSFLFTCEQLTRTFRVRLGNDAILRTFCFRGFCVCLTWKLSISLKFLIASFMQNLILLLK